jgi:hypothetical protein
MAYGTRRNDDPPGKLACDTSVSPASSLVHLVVARGKGAMECRAPSRGHLGKPTCSCSSYLSGHRHGVGAATCLGCSAAGSALRSLCASVVAKRSGASRFGAAWAAFQLPAAHQRLTCMIPVGGSSRGCDGRIRGLGRMVAFAGAEPL